MTFFCKISSDVNINIRSTCINCTPSSATYWNINGAPGVHFSELVAWALVLRITLQWRYQNDGGEWGQQWQSARLWWSWVWQWSGAGCHHNLIILLSTKLKMKKVTYENKMLQFFFFKIFVCFLLHGRRPCACRFL